MSARHELLVEARVHACEREAVKAAVRQLAAALKQADGDAGWRVGVRFAPFGLQDVAGEIPSALLLSLAPEVASPPADFEAFQRRWRDGITRLAAHAAPVYLLNVFRHVAARNRDGAPTPVLERIRQLNRMAVGLSQATGAAVVDIDRACADAGARLLACDWTLASAPAAEVAGAQIVSCLLSTGLDRAMDPAVQERAKAAHARVFGNPVQLARRIIERERPSTEAPHAP